MLLPARSASFDYGSRYLVRTPGSPAPLMPRIGLGAALGPALRGARVQPAIATRNV